MQKGIPSLNAKKIDNKDQALKKSSLATMNLKIY